MLAPSLHLANLHTSQDTSLLLTPDKKHDAASAISQIAMLQRFIQWMNMHAALVLLS